MLLSFSLNQTIHLKQIEKLILSSIFLLLCYPFIVFSSEAKWSFINLFIYLYSALFFINCFLSFKHKGIQTWNILGFSYFLCLWLNTLQLSSLQVEKNIFDLYIMLLGPSLFILLLQLTERISVLPFNLNLKLININYCYVLLILLYVSLSFYNYTQVGWRLAVIRNQHQIISGDQFIVPIFSGLWAVLSWILVMLAPHVKKRYAFIAFASIIIFSGILHVKRGDIIRVFLFSIIWLLSSKNSYARPFNLKKYLGIFLFGLAIIIIFVLFGQWRLAQSGSSANAIIDLTQVRLNNVYFAWLFAYLIIQFDVFSFSVAALQKIPYSMNELHHLFTSIYPEGYNSLIPIKAFNAGTGFWSFYRDYGNFFFLEMLVFWFLIIGLIWLSKKTECQGAYYFICLLSALMIFGNYFCSRSMILAIIFSNIIYFISYDKKSKIN